MTAVDPVVLQELGRAHPLARHVGDFLTDLANASVSGHTLRAYRGDLAQFAAHHDGEIGTWTPRRSGPTSPASPAWLRRRASASGRRWPRSAAGRYATTCCTRRVRSFP